MTREPKIPINTYYWFYKDIDECLENSTIKEYLMSVFCVNHKMMYSRELGFSTKKELWYFRIELFDI